jgi:hypothetical protein
MKKKILAGIVMFTMVMASVMSVTAADSKTKEPTVSEASKPTTDQSGQQHGYVIRTGADQFTIDDSGVPSEAKKAVEKFNAGTITVETMVGGAGTDAAKAVKDKDALTPVFDLHDIGLGKKNAAGKHEVVLDVPSLTEEYDKDSVVVLHYSNDQRNATAKAWEVIKPSSVDLKNKKITAEFEDLSPVIIYATKLATGEGSGSSDSTVGTSSTWMLWAAAALVVVGAGVVVSQKKSR